MSILVFRHECGDARRVGIVKIVHGRYTRYVAEYHTDKMKEEACSLPSGRTRLHIN